MKIKKLPPEVISKIAAGEVIENPASCVRELVENSLDAGAEEISVEIKNGGIECIVVKDNGSGMEKDEIPLAVSRYTTSKIEKIEDLEKKITLGFRGEALHSITAVSRLTIISSVDESGEGWKGEFSFGEFMGLKPSPHGKGTTVVVENLFENLPVRRKFLSGPKQEARRVYQELVNYAFWFRGISFRFRDNEKEKFYLPANQSLEERISAILGDEFRDSLWEVYFEREHIKIYGFVSKPDYLKGSAVNQVIMINGRRVKHDGIRKAIYRAYNQGERHPSFILLMEVNPSFLDFNIHPQKKKVKFSKGLRIFEKVYMAVSETLAKEKKNIGTSIAIERGVYSHGRDRFQMVVSEPKNERQGEQLEFGEVSVKSELQPQYEYTPQNIWQVHKSYIFAQTKNGIIIVDQHAAHERILYEKLKNKDYSSQTLLFPIIVELTNMEASIFEEYEDLFKAFGFEFRKLRGSSVIIDKVPSIFKKITKDFIRELINSLEDTELLPEKFDSFLKTLACKAAIKFGDSLSQDEMVALLDQLFASQNPFFCPHGRPTIYRITLEELEKRFGR